MATSTRSGILLVALLIVAGCGGQAPATGGPPAGTPLLTAGADPTAVPPAGGGATDAPVAGGIDACDILTTAEIQAIVGSAVTAESGGEPVGGQSICTFSTAAGQGILYTAYESDGVVGFDAWKAQSAVQSVPGLGDEAIFHPQIGLMVRHGQETFQFYPLGNMSPEDALNLALELAGAASSRF